MRRPLALSLALAAAAVGCGNGGGDGCIEVTTDCDPLYQPTFDNVHSRTLLPKCGIDGPCHNPGAAQAGLVFADPDQSYDLLLGGEGGRVRVEPGDPGCSELTRRLESSSASFRMPPGNTPLAPEERCAINQWIAGGAER